VVVGGRYLTGPSMTLRADNSIDYQRFGEVLDGLFEMAREQPPVAYG
jgi:hypothetical protein